MFIAKTKNTKRRQRVLEMYNKHIVSIQKKIEKGSVSKSMKKAFTIE